jgi:hypothetical protein
MVNVERERETGEGDPLPVNVLWEKVRRVRVGVCDTVCVRLCVRDSDLTDGVNVRVGVCWEGEAEVRVGVKVDWDSVGGEGVPDLEAVL